MNPASGWVEKDGVAHHITQEHEPIFSDFKDAAAEGLANELEFIARDLGDKIHGAGNPVKSWGASELSDGENHLGRALGPTNRRLDGRMLRKGTFIARISG